MDSSSINNTAALKKPESKNWSPEEDKILIQYVRENNTEWTENRQDLERLLPGRSLSSFQSHYSNRLKTQITVLDSDAEKKQLALLYMK